MNRILILFAHPAFEKSRVNKVLIEGIDQLEGVTFHDLYQAYPDMDIDLESEQSLLEQHDIIIFQHPFFWYSVPSILKEYVDIVLTHGWAYGSQGNALKGKQFFNVISTGGSRHAYSEEGHNHFTIRQLLAPMEQTIYTCKMTFLPPYVVHGTHSIKKEEIEGYRTQYHQLLSLLSQERIPVGSLSELCYMNDYSINR